MDLTIDDESKFPSESKDKLFTYPWENMSDTAHKKMLNALDMGIPNFDTSRLGYKFCQNNGGAVDHGSADNGGRLGPAIIYKPDLKRINGRRWMNDAWVNLYSRM